MPSDVEPAALRRWTPGDPVPLFHAATDSIRRFAFGSVAGRYCVLVCLGSTVAGGAAEAWHALRQAQAAGILDDATALAFVVTTDPDDAARGLRDVLPGLRVFRDPDGGLSRSLGAQPAEGADRPFALLLDPMLRVIACETLERVPALIALLETLPEPALHAGVETPAPVLLLPRVLEPAFCRSLVEYYEAHGGSPSGFMVARDGKTVGVSDPSRKRRKDCPIEDEGLRDGLRLRLVGRLLPEIRKAFQFKASRIERYVVSCYDAADQGFFGAHRDNTTPGTAHRRFAVTVNLNEDFEGGELRFPEFGPRCHRPPLGGAVVFSCSLLHEARPVTSGCRYATLPFLYDEEGARIRRENAGSLVT